MDSAKSELKVIDRQLMDEKTYWMKKLSRNIEISGLIPDYPRPSARADRIESKELNLAGDSFFSLDELTRGSLFLMYAALSAAVKVCLHKYTGSLSIVVGSPTLKDEESSHPLNALAILDDLDERLTFKQLLLNVRQTLLDAYTNQHYPFGRLIIDLGMTLTDNRCPLFDIALEMEEIHREMPDVNHDIAIKFKKRESRITGIIEYRGDLFRPETIDLFSRQLIYFLERAASNTEALISDLQIHSEAERRQALFEWNDTSTHRPVEYTACRLFELQAASIPHAIAVVSEAGQLSYAELDRRADQVAGYLISLGVVSETLVAIYMEKSLEAIIAILAASKAGAGYLPLDPAYPRDRIALMLEDSQVPIILTLQYLEESLPERNARVICLDLIPEITAREIEERHVSNARPYHLAYVIYTSGSTGRPKGVLSEQAGLTNLVEAQIRLFGLNRQSRVLQFSALTFDASVSEIFTSLASGAALYISSPKSLLIGPTLLDALTERGITIVTLPPSILGSLPDNNFPGLAGLATIVSAGENCSADLAARWAKGRCFLNAYGPTETTVCATVGECAGAGQTPTIGRPICNTRIYLLDSGFLPSTIGGAGEIYIGGTGLARGYLNRPDLTAEKFIPDPFSQIAGARLYKTSDLARHKPDGSIEFLGRIDYQVKIRGYRVEPGEIETVIRQSPKVRQSAVIGRRNSAGDIRLIAYIVSDDTTPLKPGDLRNFLKERLPDYMIPSAFVRIDAFPLNASGKIDRTSLPEPDSSRPDLTETFISPETPIQEIVAGIWATVLGVDHISVLDNFFDLGGNSLLATQAVTRLSEVFQLELPLRALFEAPTVFSLSERIEAADKLDRGLQAPPIMPVPRAGRLPLSFAQQRLWFLNRLEPNNSAYNSPVALRLIGRLNEKVLERCFNEIVRRHEILRTAFPEIEGEPFQHIAPPQQLRLPIVDLSLFPEQERWAEAQRRVVEEARSCFDISVGSLARARLLRLAEHEHILLFTMHHIICDGWSMGVLIREIGSLYDAFSNQCPSPLPDLPIQYADFAVWQRQWMQGEILQKQLSYWTRQLAGVSQLEMPKDRPRPAIPTFRGERQSFTFSASLSDSLAALSRREGATLFMTLLAAFQTLLYRYTGQEEFVVGADIANRDHRDTEDLLGFFVNQIALRADLSGNPDFTSFLARVRETSLGAYANQDLPFEKLVESLQPDRSLNRAPLFQVKLVFQNAPTGALELRDLTLIPVEIESGMAKLDLAFMISDSEHGLAGSVEYSSDLFDDTTIKRLIAHFQTLTEVIVVAPNQRLSDLPILTKAERNQLQLEWDSTTHDRSFAPAHRLFESQVEFTPDRIAVSAERWSLSYQKLNARSNQLAHYLHGLGVRPEVRVGIYMDRSPDLIVGILGVLKAGGAYLPIDPSSPNQRSALMLEDAQPPILLTREELIGQIPTTWEQLIRLDSEWETIAEESDENPPWEIDEEHLAYLIYTSGSAGRPKGVLLRHKGLCNLARAQIRSFNISTQSRILQFASSGFDASVSEIFTALLSGATLHLEDQKIVASGENLANSLHDRMITTVTLPPSMLNELPAIELPALQTLIVAGEACPGSLVAGWSSGRNFINAYGPTETTVCASIEVCAGNYDIPPPIGRAIDNTRACVLDRNLNLAPTGVAGEIHIGGVGLARGYLNHPALTAEKFIPDPFSQQPGARVYKTGDLGRFLLDRRLEFLGRLDHQVKLHGYRIELGEIESAARQHPAIREILVALREDTPGGKGLVAYITTESGTRLEIGELRKFLKSRLPDYMLPANLVHLDKMPLNASGKIDRRSLPAPIAKRHEAEAAFETSPSPLEEIVSELFSQLLGVEKIRRHDDFFEMGGHSLLGARLIARLNEMFQIELPMQALFEAPSVAGVAANLLQAQHSACGMKAPPITPVDRNKRLPLSFGQQRLWFLDRLEPNSPFYNVPIIINLKGLKGPVDERALERSFIELLRRHEALRTIFPFMETQPVQVVVSSAGWMMSIVDLSELSAEQRKAERLALIVEEGRRTFDLAQGLLFRAILLRLGEDEHALILTTHHIVFDGWSIGILTQEIAANYEAFVQGEDSPLPSLPIQYADFSVWQREWLQGDVLKAELDYWKRQLDGDLPILQIPTDRPRPPIQTYHGATRTFALQNVSAEKLRTLNREEGVTLFMSLLAAFKVLLYRYTGQTDIIVGAPIANRNRASIERLIGLFVNTLALRSDLSGSPSFRQLLRQARKVTLDAYAHQDLPFDKLLEALPVRRDVGVSPIFQVMLALQHAALPPIELPGLILNLSSVETNTAKFDITLSIAETEGGLDCALQYNTDLFDPVTIDRMIDHYRAILDAALTFPDRPISQLSFFNEAERAQLLLEFNRTSRAYPQTTIHELFRRQAQMSGDSIAVICGQEQMSYEELDDRSDLLGSYLRRMGVSEETRVGVIMERGIEMIIALLGILKAGAAYVPLDPESPRHRISHALQESGAALIIGQDRFAEHLPPGYPPAINLKKEWEKIDGCGREGLRQYAEADNLAYVMYTSGSTGKPKGVSVTHRAVVRLIKDVDYVSLGPIDVLLQYAPLSFDASTFEIWGALLNRGKLAAMPAGPAGLEELTGYILQQQVSALWLTAAIFHQMEDRHFDNLRGVRQLLAGGDALSRSQVKKALLWLSGTQLINGYGPTEATTFSCCHAIQKGEEINRSVPIGKPTTNTKVYVLDGNLELSPVGVVGQLYISGDGLARGYLIQPALTADRFMPNPYNPTPGARMYQTGDMVRWDKNGRIEFIERLDNQVKIRGYRVEPEEIEEALKEHEAIIEAVVVASREVSGDKKLIGYVTTSQGARLSVARIRRHLEERVPSYMIPSAIVILDKIPLSTNGKLDRKALPEAGAARPELDEDFILPRTEAERIIAGVWQEALCLEKVGVNDNFFDLGGHSLLMAQVQVKLQELFKRSIPMVDLFRSPTIAHLAASLSSDRQRQPDVAVNRNGRKTPAIDAGRRESEIAIIGMAGRFPGAKNIEEFWKNLANGMESVRSFSDEELLAAGVSPELLKNPHYVKAGVVLEDCDRFDASFFGFSPREAEILNPQHRFFLECAWEALENACCSPEKFEGRIGVFAGESISAYIVNLMSCPDLIDSVGEFHLVIQNDKDHLTTTTSYELNLNGPSVTVQTACSTSLVAAHLACQSLRNGECDIALAGGVSINARQGIGYIYRPEGIASPDGHCRAFDALAQGTIGGSGVGIVALKRLSDAIRDGDRIEAVIKGTAINNDGAMKVGYTAPSVNGQAEVIKEALREAGVEAGTISYVEAHGTATPLGDPIEIAALSEAYRTEEDDGGRCAIGSVKTNIGHLDAAAGVAGLIKTVMSLKRKQLPASLNYKSANERLGLERTRFYVNTELRPWKAEKGPRRAGVSSFGLGGTNAHLILEEAPEEKIPKGEESKRPQLIILSAKTESALSDMSTNLARWMDLHNEADLADIAYTLQVGRTDLSHRRMLVCQDFDGAKAALHSLDPLLMLMSHCDGAKPAVSFMFPGQGSQYSDMAHELYRADSIFRKQIDLCSELFERELQLDLRRVLFSGKADDQAAEERLSRTFIAQPVLFTVEYSLAKMWMNFGVNPVAMIGHSIGEYVAACLAGVFSLEDAIRLVALRGRLMQQVPSGAMLAVNLPESQLLGILNEDINLAAVNGPDLCVLSGPTREIELLHERLLKERVQCHRLHTSHAFHSAMMEPIIAAFIEQVGQVTLNPPKIHYISNVTGNWIAADQATDPNYWGAHIRQTVRFAEGVEALLEHNDQVLLEVGPGNTLSGIVRRIAAGDKRINIVATLPRPDEPQSDEVHLLNSIGRLWMAGVKIDWKKYYGGRSMRLLALPTYPFERSRYWIERQNQTGRFHAPQSVSYKKKEITKWFYMPSWSRSVPLAFFRSGEAFPERQCWLLFDDGSDIAAEMTKRLRQEGQTVISVIAGGQFAETGEHTYTVNPERPDHYYDLVEQLVRMKIEPGYALHFWSLSTEPHPDSGKMLFERYQDLGFYSLIYLAQAIRKLNLSAQIKILLISSHIQSVNGQEELIPAKATILGPCKVISQELPNVICRSIDLETPVNDPEKIANCLLAELDAERSEPVVAYRGGHRWVQSFMPVQVEPASKTRIKLKEGGCYLITGGTGRIGLLFAEFLAVAAKAKLVLMGHSTLPEEEVWDQWLANHDWNDANSRIINKLRELKAIGSEVEIISADLADEKQMERAVASMVERFGPINGVIHSAGRAGEKSIRMIEELDREECERHFQSKIYGLKSLERALVNEPLDFFLLQSSLSSILGGLGFSAYSAANHFMDAFAEWRNRSNSTRCVSVNWDGWRLGDEAVIHARPGARLQAAAIEPAEGVEALEYLLTMEGMPRVIVSTSDLQRRVDEWIELQSPGGMDAGDSGVISLYPRRNLSNEYIAPTDELEREIAEMCRSLLGIEQVGLNDNFFEMGGHSLLAIQLIARLREVFHIEISLRGFFESPTVLNLAETVRKFRETASQPQSDPIIRVLRDRHRVEITSEGKMSLPEALRKR